MKKGAGIMLFVCACAAVFVVGVFLGRNVKDDYRALGQNQTQAIVTTMEANDYRLDINTATKVQLMELPGIGETIADRIIAFREVNGNYVDTDGLLQIDGIGEMKLRQIEGLIKVGG